MLSSSLKGSILAFLLLLTACSRNEEPLTAETSEPTAVSDATAPLMLAAPGAGSDPTELLASWDGGQITRRQMEQILKPRLDHIRMSVQSAEALRQMLEQQQKAIVATLTDNYLLVLEARKRGIELTPADKENLIRQVKERYDTEEKYLQAIQLSGQTEEDLIKVLANIELGKKCLEQERQNFLNAITPEMLTEYYQKNLELFTSKTRTDINRVVVEYGEKRSRDEAQVRAHVLYDEVKDQVARAVTFKDKRKVLQDYAKNYSDSWEATYNYGYTIIYHMPDQDKYSPEFLQAVLDTPEEGLSEIVENKDSFVFFLVKERFPSNRHEFESDVVQNMLPNLILTDKLEAWRKSLQEQYHLQIFEENMRVPLEYAQQLYEQPNPFSPANVSLDPNRRAFGSAALNSASG